MRLLWKKLHSESGASILLALLLFLVCCMVAVSILAAAASNAGKIRSNRAEQQKYLTLSSAIRLVADEIREAEYEGQYRVYEWTVETRVETVVRDAGGNVTDSDTSTTREDFFYIEQIEGVYSCGLKRGLAAEGELTGQIPLGRELDKIFSKQFPGTGSGYEPLPASYIEDAVPRKLTVTLPNDLEGYPYPNADPDSDPMKAYKVPNVVTVRVQLNHDTQHIMLTAWLGTDAEPPADKSDTMIAELVARNVPVLDYNRKGRKAGGSAPTAAGPTTTETTTGTTKVTTTKTTTVDKDGSIPDKTGPAMQWELHWIRKGVS